MTRKTLTISEQAYNTLARVKGKNESFTEVILRLTGKRGKRTKGTLLEYIRSIAPNNQLADSIEKVLEKRNRIHLRTARVTMVRRRQMTKASKSMDDLRRSSKEKGWSGAREIRRWRDDNAKLRDVAFRPLSETKGMIPGLNTKHLREEKGQMSKTAKSREDPLFRLKRVRFRAKVPTSEVDRLLYGDE